MKKKRFLEETMDVWKAPYALYGKARGFSGEPLTDEELHCAWCHKTVAEIKKTEDLSKHLTDHDISNPK